MIKLLKTIEKYSQYIVATGGKLVGNLGHHFQPSTEYTRKSKGAAKPWSRRGQIEGTGSERSRFRPVHSLAFKSFTPT